MDKSLFFSKLFDEEDLICTGGYKAVNVSKNVFGNFFSINSLKEKRTDLNVTKFRNFLFEMDDMSLEDQLEYWKFVKVPITSLVYSGGKSYHALLSLETPLEAEVGTRQGVDKYKQVWETIALNLEAKAGKQKLFDRACKNPSRLSRIPGVRRSNGNEQKLIELNARINKKLFIECFGFDYDLVEVPESNFSNINQYDIYDTSDFWRMCPTGLKNKLRYVDWADSSGMYPEILKLTYWAIDSTGIDKDTFMEVLWERTFPRLIDAGYPSEKLTVAVDHAYNEKRRS